MTPKEIYDTCSDKNHPGFDCYTEGCPYVDIDHPECEEKLKKLVEESMNNKPCENVDCWFRTKNKDVGNCKVVHSKALHMCKDYQPPKDELMKLLDKYNDMVFKSGSSAKILEPWTNLMTAIITKLNELDK